VTHPDDPGVFPPDFIDPIANRALPWIEHYDPTTPDPFPEYRLDDEPGWDDVEVDNDAPQLRGIVAPGVAGINIASYARTPASKGWGSPCSGQRATVRLQDAAVTVDVRIAELVGLIMREAERRGYIHRKIDTGAYNCRKIAGSTAWSNHAWALAIDVNWQTNPYTSPLKTDIPVWYRHLWNRYGFAWGGDYSGRKDAMHFEAMGTPAQMQASLVLARRELADLDEVQQIQAALGFTGEDVDGDWGPATDHRLNLVRMALNGVIPAVTDLQLVVGTIPDGEWGPASQEALAQTVRKLQAALGVGVDGEWGPQTQAAYEAFRAEHFDA
jgi:hypothetical protein